MKPVLMVLHNWVPSSNTTVRMGAAVHHNASDAGGGTYLAKRGEDRFLRFLPVHFRLLLIGSRIPGGLELRHTGGENTKPAAYSHDRGGSAGAGVDAIADEQGTSGR